MDTMIRGLVHSGRAERRGRAGVGPPQIWPSANRVRPPKVTSRVTTHSGSKWASQYFSVTFWKVMPGGGCGAVGLSAALAPGLAGSSGGLRNGSTPSAGGCSGCRLLGRRFFRAERRRNRNRNLPLLLLVDLHRVEQPSVAERAAAAQQQHDRADFPFRNRSQQPHVDPSEC